MAYVAGFEPNPSLGQIRHRLRGALGPVRRVERLSPVWQLIHAVISGQTPESVSRAALERLLTLWPRPEGVMCARPEEVEAAIEGVEHAEPKSRWLVAALRTLHNRYGELSLSFLGEMPVEVAFRKLKNLTGVGPKAAAATLNFSSLKRRILVVDSQVCRTANRLGLASHADLGKAQAELSEYLDPAWDGDDLFELHWLFRRHSQDYCLAQAPACGRCPLADLCPSARPLN